MVEAGYIYNPEGLILEHYLEEPADYNWQTLGDKEACLEGLGDCNFSYSDGKEWVTSWDEKKETYPRAIKVNFKFQYEDKESEFVVNIPISP